MNTIKAGVSSIRSGSQARSNRSNRSRSRSAMRSGRSSMSAGSRSRSGSNRMSTGSRNSDISGHLSFEGLQNTGDVYAFNDPEQRNEGKELAKSFWKKFSDNVWNNDNTWVKAFLIVSCFATLVILAIECAIFGLFMVRFDYDIGKNDIFNPINAIYGFYRYYLKQKRRAMAAYLALYIYAEVYQAFMTLVVLYTRNVFHLTSCILFLIAMAIYSGIEYNELENTITNINAYSKLFETATSTFNEHTGNASSAINGLSIVVIVISALSCLILAFIGYKLRSSFKQTAGETIGNNNKLITANVIFNFHRDALLLAFFFCPGFFLQAIIIAPDKSDAEFGLSIAGLVLSFIVILTSDFYASREMKLGTIFSNAWFVLGLALIIVKLVRIYTRYSDEDLPGRQSVVAFGVITALLLVGLIILSSLVVKNFGLGLYQIYSRNYNWLSKAKDQPIPNRASDVLGVDEKGLLQSDGEAKGSGQQSVVSLGQQTSQQNNAIGQNSTTQPMTHAALVSSSVPAYPQREDIDF
ncbi:hypothetical protein CANARDRAFT_30674 [[Candida] arabinofermentans NRRL YB-2248]|uniref:Uncharacterized protein n=1 Tax=[Candida] arabinofermentans NRRL YB-2248 TaxID=983967 RepID=A0A1E4ST22_9ASCO|nr:hypothetical protein CANARDRAFT_30674 [[Candida] arabinofermentans NRRL YB-2248]